MYGVQRYPAVRATLFQGGGYFPVAIRLRAGEILCVVRGGGPHISIKGRLDVLTSSDNGVTWTRQTVVDGPYDDRDPALGELSDGTVVLAYVVAGGYTETGETFRTGSDRRGWVFGRPTSCGPRTRNARGARRSAAA